MVEDVHQRLSIIQYMKDHYGDRLFSLCDQPLRSSVEVDQINGIIKEDLSLRAPLSGVKVKPHAKPRRRRRCKRYKRRTGNIGTKSARIA